MTERLRDLEHPLQVEIPDLPLLGLHAKRHDRALRGSYTDYRLFLEALHPAEIGRHMAFLTLQDETDIPAVLCTVDTCYALWRWLRYRRDVMKEAVTPVSQDVWETMRAEYHDLLTDLVGLEIAGVEPASGLDISRRERRKTPHAVIARLIAQAESRGEE